MKIFSSANNAFYSFSRWASCAGAVFLAVMVLVTACDVVGRYVFGRPVSGALEMIEYLMLVLGALGLGWATLRDVHIRVDIVVENFKQHIQLFFDILTHTFCLIIYVLLSWQTIVEGLNSLLEYKDASEVLRIPAYPFYFFLALGFIMLSIAIIIKIVLFIGKLVKK